MSALQWTTDTGHGDTEPDSGCRETPANPPPWAALYRTPAGRHVYIVHNGSEADGYRPITGDSGTVRVEYVAPDGSQADPRYAEYGWEHPDGLTDGGHGEDGLRADSRAREGAVYSIGRGEDGLYVPILIKPDGYGGLPVPGTEEHLGVYDTPDQAKAAAERHDYELATWAGLCAHDNVPILKVDGVWLHIGDVTDTIRRRNESEFDYYERPDVVAAEDDLFSPHTIEPRPGTVTTADVWDVDDALAGRYSTPGGEQ